MKFWLILLALVAGCCTTVTLTGRSNDGSTTETVERSKVEDK